MTSNAAISINRRIRRDPTRTTRIRAAFVRDVRRRWAALKADIRKSVIDQDCFALDSSRLVLNSPTGRKAFDFPRSDSKVKAFMKWLEEQEKKGILEIITRPGDRLSAEEAWTNVYIRSAYQQGIERARAEMKKANIPGVSSVPGGVSGAMNAGFHADRAGLAYSRVYEDLKTVVDATNARIRRQLSEVLREQITTGIIEGRNPKAIARNIMRSIDAIGKTRAEMIARTEVIRAHTQATLVEYQQAAGDIEVAVQAEVSTAGFDVCPICEALAAGGPYALAKAENMLPAHPNCRCAFIPYVDVAAVRAHQREQRTELRRAA